MQYAIMFVAFAAAGWLQVQANPIDAQGVSSFLVRSDDVPDYFKTQRYYSDPMEDDPIVEFNKELMSRSVDALQAAADDRENANAEQDNNQGVANSVWERDTLKHNFKRNNNYYMSLCHFKICNMGRKRTTRRL